MLKLTSLVALSLLAAALAWGSEPKDDRAAVQRAATDYLDAIYEAKPDLIARSVATNLSKHGYYRNAQGEWRMSTMTYTQLHTLAGRWNEGGKKDTSKMPREVVVGDVFDRIATAKVVADWGIDHMQLMKMDDGAWKIVNIVWQSHPKK